VWTGGADEVQLRAARSLDGLRLRFVSVPPAARRSRARLRAHAAQADGSQAPVIIPREQWGAAAVPPRAAPSYGEVDMAFVHHTETANDYAPEDSAGIVLAIAKYHRDTNGWNDIGYNFLADKYGQVFEGRAGGIEQAVIGAHAQGWNSKSTGIAIIGSHVSVPAPEPAVAAVARLIAWKLSLHGTPVTGTVQLVSGGGSQNRYKYGARVTFDRVSGHRDGCTTTCPGNALYAQLPALRSRAAALAASFGPAQDPRLTITAADRTVAYGEDAVFSGRLLGPDGETPAAGVRISLQKRGTKGWTTLARATTDSDGRWDVRVPWRRSGTVRAAAITTGQPRSAAMGVAVLAALRVTAPRRNGRVLTGRSVAVRGTVRPAGGVTVRLERQAADGRWHKVADVRARSRGGRFQASVPLRHSGLHRLTARTGSGAGATAAPAVYVRAVLSAADVRTGGVVAS
jgi:5-hydroxyisourate hydrolase-like protein (transthyretin family)